MYNLNGIIYSAPIVTSIPTNDPGRRVLLEGEALTSTVEIHGTEYSSGLCNLKRLSLK